MEERGSSTISVELKARNTEFSGYEVKHGEEILGASIPSGSSLGSGEEAVEPFQIGRRQPGLPVTENAFEVPLDRLGDVVERRDDVVDAVRAVGYRYVTLDLDGLRSGNLNDALPSAERGTAPVDLSPTTAPAAATPQGARP